eukprot:Hpha_TRINITY_DN15908_c11_g1::TRINITY_DN15908_c11_g1_i3::g.71512::m.71512
MALAMLTATALSGTFVARVPNANAELLRKIAGMECNECATDHGRVDMWDPDGIEPEHIHDAWQGTVDVRGGAALRELLSNTTHELMHHDFDAAIEAEKNRVRGPRAADRDDFFEDYRTLAEIRTRLNQWTQEYEGTSLFTVGQSYLGEDIKGIRFGSSSENHATWIQCGIHSREWIAPATCMYFAQKLLNGLKNKDPVVTALLSKTFVYLTPVLNVDGYLYTWSDNRMWRKNRQPNEGSSAMGTDLNRNWAADWGKCGASTFPSSDTYRGSAVWSAPETTAVRDFISALKRDGYKVLGGHDFHSYGELLLRSYGWTKDNAPNNAIEEERGAKMVQAIKASSGLQYTNQKAYDLYCCSGLACDYISEQTTEYSGFTFELRGTPGGFVLPPDQIVPSGEEIYDAMIVWFTEVTYSKTFSNSTA